MKIKRIKVIQILLTIALLFLIVIWGLLGNAQLAKAKIPTPCDPWKDSCPGGALYCFTLGPLTCYCAESPCLK